MVKVRGVIAAVAALLLSAAAPAPDRVLSVANHGRQPITELYVSDASSDDWGDERLGGSDLAPARAVTLHLGRGRTCDFDIRVVFADSSVEERHGFDVCHNRQTMFDGSTAETMADHGVTVTNNSSRPVRELYIVSGQTDGWGEDKLTDASILPGKSAHVSYHGRCHGDVRVVFDNDGAEERYDMDLCAGSALNIVPGWDTAD